MFDDLDPEELLRYEPAWHEAVGRLAALHAAHGEQARVRLAEIQQRYVDRRPAMIVDAVMSVQQDYERVVLPLVERFDQTPAAASLDALARLDGIDQTLFNNSPRRMATIVAVAEGLLRYGRERGLSDEEAARSWARPLGIRALRGGCGARARGTLSTLDEFYGPLPAGGARVAGDTLVVRRGCGVPR